jgi:hypothetical protein
MRREADGGDGQIISLTEIIEASILLVCNVMIQWIRWSDKYLKNVDLGVYLQSVSIFGFKDTSDKLTSLANVRSETHDSPSSKEVLKPSVHKRDTFRYGPEFSGSLTVPLFHMRLFTVFFMF